MSTPFAKPGQIERKWYVVDATDKTLGRLATRIATVLKGKHKAQFTPHADTGDFVIVTNAGKVRLTGKKMTDKLYHWHTGYPGGLKTMQAGHMIERDPGRVLKLAVKGMLPNTSLHRRMLGKLKVYRGAEHPHSAQKPEPLPL